MLLIKSWSIDIFVRELSGVFSLKKDNFEEIDLSTKDRFDLMLVVSTDVELSLNKS